MSFIGPLAIAIGASAIAFLIGCVIGEGIVRFIPWNANRLIRKRYYLYCTICKGRLYVNRHPKHNSHTEDCEMRYRK